ncbi:unnamed protein product [Trifolium pratense]|uniref:Uncharacterized protein n=1 Tax=Trifolium pratense TaxID=57577 RepID=A0ACB0M4Z4_TRIPR|nr:unnamed protein product [Trifolium pratense]
MPLLHRWNSLVELACKSSSSFPLFNLGINMLIKTKNIVVVNGVCGGSIVVMPGSTISIQEIKIFLCNTAAQCCRF